MYKKLFNNWSLRSTIIQVYTYKEHYVWVIKVLNNSPCVLL